MEFKHFIIPKKIQNELDKDALLGKIVTRFPPEPSAPTLHVGHASALYFNACIAKKYNGKLIIRMDDTNPMLESIEYETGILQDLQMLGIDTKEVTHSSDYFEFLIECCERLLYDNLAYVDLTDVREMRLKRDTGIETVYRNASKEDNFLRWNLMKDGTLKTGCVRAKIDMSHKNKAMRDPTIFRPLDVEHHKTGKKFKVYPTYDFSCPIVDSIEGITHVFRSTEFNERDEQYHFILPALNMKIPKLYHYGKLNIIDAVMSKRKIKECVLNKEYDGWDDPRLFTLRGLRRRGLCLEGLEEFIKCNGYPGLDCNVEAVSMWTINKKFIDKISSRYIILDVNISSIHLKVGANDPNHLLDDVKDIDKFQRNKDLGKKKIYYTKNIILNKENYDSLKDGEEITLMNYGNMIYKKPYFETNLQGDFRKTEKKLLWLPDHADNVVVIITSYNNNCKQVNTYIGEPSLINMKIGEYVQFLKKNYCICSGKNDNVIEFIEIP
jgi:glutamyl-tRNA synthetase